MDVNRVYFFVSIFVLNALVSFNIATNNENINAETKKQSNSNYLQPDSYEHNVTPVSPKKSNKNTGIQECLMLLVVHPVSPVDKKDQESNMQFQRQSSESFLATIPSQPNIDKIGSCTDLESSLSGLRLSAPINTFHGVTPIKATHGVSPLDRIHEVTPVK